MLRLLNQELVGVLAVPELGQELVGVLAVPVLGRLSHLLKCYGPHVVGALKEYIDTISTWEGRALASRQRALESLPIARLETTAT